MDKPDVVRPEQFPRLLASLHLLGWFYFTHSILVTYSPMRSGRMTGANGASRKHAIHSTHDPQPDQPGSLSGSIV